MLKIKGHRGIFAFSDPAGAKACLALVKSIKNKETLIISDRKYSFYSEFNLEVNSCEQISIKEWFNIFKPDFVFTGTSMPNKIELKFLKEAKKKELKHILLLIIGLTYLKDLNISMNIYIQTNYG